MECLWSQNCLEQRQLKAQELVEEAYRNYTVHSVIELYRAVK